MKGRGIRIASALAPEHAELIEDLKEQLLLVFLRRLGGQVSVPVAEIDATGGYDLAFRIDENKVFHFEIRATPGEGPRG